MWKHRWVKQEMATYITKRRQSLSCSARSFSDIPAMKKSSADKLRWQNSFSQFRRTTRDWSHSCISPQTEMDLTHTYINFFSFWLNNLYTEIKPESNCRIPGHSFTCHWIRTALVLRLLPTHVSEADQSGWVFCSLAELKERFIRFFLCWSLQCLQMKPSFITTGPCSF